MIENSPLGSWGRGFRPFHEFFTDCGHTWQIDSVFVRQSATDEDNRLHKFLIKQQPEIGSGSGSGSGT